MASLETKRDIARFLSLEGIMATPAVADGLLFELRNLTHHEEKVRYMHKFIALFKEHQALTGGRSSGAIR